MQNWARCANHRKKQTMLKRNCCIDTECAKQRLYSSIINHLQQFIVILILRVQFCWVFFSFSSQKENNFIRTYSCQLLNRDILTSSGLAYATQGLMKNSVKNKDESHSLKTGLTNTVIQQRGLKIIVIKIPRILQNRFSGYYQLPF